MTNIPHIALPLRFVNGRMAVTEQDSPQEISDCIETILRTPVGARPELPEFGTPDQAFQENGASIVELELAIDDWEPRASVLFRAEPDAFDSLISRVQAETQND